MLPFIIIRMADFYFYIIKIPIVLLIPMGEMLFRMVRRTENLPCLPFFVYLIAINPI